VTEDEAIARILEALDTGRGGWVQTPNLDHLRRFHVDPAAREWRNRADLTLADGTPIIWASRLQGTPLPARVPGSDLVWSVSQAAAARGRSIYLLGGNPGVGAAAHAALTERFPGLAVAGDYSPPFGFERSPEERGEAVRRVAEARPDVVLVGLPFLKAEALIEDLRAALPGTWLLALGASLSFVAGDVRRAPAWMHDAGLEWLWRLREEPRRLFRRYVVEGLPFAARLFASAARTRLAR
jgi:N-acetylglucosaminyldiphosphoundecaprenol N-acetyl-beta-D-mannosaminyltransferase